MKCPNCPNCGNDETIRKMGCRICSKCRHVVPEDFTAILEWATRVVPDLDAPLDPDDE